MKKITLVILLLMVAVTGTYAMALGKKQKRRADDIVSVTIHRTVCFGKCPDYMVEINQDGTATYTARRFTTDTGIFKKNITKEKAAEILSLCSKYRIDTCAEMYENRISDLPGLNFTINYRKHEQKIFNSTWGPAFLVEIAEAMEAVGIKPEDADDSWKKVGMPKM